MGEPSLPHFEKAGAAVYGTSKNIPYSFALSEPTKKPSRKRGGEPLPDNHEPQQTDTPKWASRPCRTLRRQVRQFMAPQKISPIRSLLASRPRSLRVSAGVSH